MQTFHLKYILGFVFCFTDIPFNFFPFFQRLEREPLIKEMEKLPLVFNLAEHAEEEEARDKWSERRNGERERMKEEGD